MTGFGLSSFIDKKSEIYIEIKGVNHKFLEATIKPNDLNNELEEFIRNLVSKKIVRGRVDIRIKINNLYQLSNQEKIYVTTLENEDIILHYFNILSFAHFMNNFINLILS